MRILANLNESESSFLGHISMFGSAAYPVRKLGRGWVFDRMFGAGGTPIVYKTKRAAVEAVEAYYRLLLDRHAGRI